MNPERARDHLEAGAAEMTAAENREDRDVFRAMLWVAGMGTVVIVALSVWP